MTSERAQPVPSRDPALPTLDSPGLEERLASAGFRDVSTAAERLRQLFAPPPSADLLQVVVPTLLVCLSDSAQPDHVLLNFERFVHNVPDREALWKTLAANPRGIEILIRLFIGSQFLTDILLCNPGYLDRLMEQKRLADLKSVQQLYIEAQGAMLGITDPELQLDALRRFQRWELLRIGLCDFFGLFDLRRVTTQLSLLADALTRACLTHACSDSDPSEEGFCVIAMGKLGGEELNYSSDIDLLFVAANNSSTHWRIGQKLIKALTGVSAAGFMYRVDMRLRPWGRAGELVSAVDSHLQYLAQHARLWEKQALLKARVIAGDLALGNDFLRRAAQYVYQSPPDQVREAVRTMKAKIEDDLRKKGRLWGEVKLGEGSIRDIEFVVQYLQLVHGGGQPAVRSFQTLDALVRLADLGFLHADEYRLLSDGYVFLRSVEHALQLMHNKQVHELPRDPAELGYLARRLDFPNSEHFLSQYQKHRESVRRVYNRYLGDRDKVREQEQQQTLPQLNRHLARLRDDYSRAFSEPDIEHHARIAEQVTAAQPVIVEALPENNDWRVTIVGYDYPGELSLIAGLLLLYGFDIVEGQIFTYAPLAPAQSEGTKRPTSRPAWSRQAFRRPMNRPESGDRTATGDHRAKIVDVFTVRSTVGPVTPELWASYTNDLRELLRMLQAGQREEAHGSVLKRVAARLRPQVRHEPSVLYPLDVQIDNSSSDEYTKLVIQGQDTMGFLYELTNALALSGVYISQVRVLSEGNQIHDTLFVTDAQGQKITDHRRLWELQATLVLIKHFTHLLPQSPNPESALLHFRDFLTQLMNRDDWAAELASLEQSDVLEALARLLGVSDFLWTDFLRMQHANLFPVLRDLKGLERPRTRRELETELAQALDGALSHDDKRTALNAFKDREMFRVDMRHILGRIPEFSQFSEELSDVAEVTVAGACQLCHAELQAEHGEPVDETGLPCPWSVCALGKCGGREIGFASDIELMFVYRGEGKTRGPQVISVTEFYIRLVEQVTQAIRAHREGIFEIDLRLRPYGRAGSMAVSLSAFEAYFGPDGPAWPYERQALVKLRPIAGNSALGAELVALRDALIYRGARFDVVAMRGMRERQLRQLVTAGTFNAKLSPGALVDVEYLVQGLQITHGAERPAVRSTNTLQAITALEQAGIIPPYDASRLCEAYNFLRQLIGALRIVRGNARDLTVPPVDSEEYAYLARRLGYEDNLPRLAEDEKRHTEAVLEISQRLLEG
ncbi:MAG TPA: glutamine synthetase adenylyltransferase [Planctomycetaceae bacterium]|nr:glutamine synthetase adenylyltransferase [Planctomycetaceae bacterium]